MTIHPKYAQNLREAEIGAIMCQTELAVMLLILMGTATVDQRLRAYHQAVSESSVDG